MSSYVFLLLILLYKICRNIIENFNDFGKDPDDAILINIALPYILYR